MNEFLTNLYNTGGESDQEEMIEKMASAQVLTDIAAQQGKDLSDVDWDQLSTEDIHELIKEASGEGAEGAEIDEDFQEKLAEWDFAGRAMAHAFHDESNQIDLVKEAFSPDQYREMRAAGLTKDQMKVLARQAMSNTSTQANADLARRSGRDVTKLPSKQPSAADVDKMRKAFDAEGKMPTYSGGSKNPGFKAGNRSTMKQLGQLPGALWRQGGKGKAQVIGGAAALAAGLGGAGYGAYKGYKAATSSVVDQLAAARAQEFLNEKLASYNENGQVEQAIQQRAAEMLYEAGYGDLLD